MVNEETPEERLKKYKERLAEMAQEEGRGEKVANPSESEKEVVRREPPPPQASLIEESISQRPKPPGLLESPAKRELRESQVVTKRRETLVKKLEGKSRSRVMLKAREKAITSQLQEIKSRKSMLELQYKRKVIDKLEYEKRMQLLVQEGRELLQEKAEIDKTLAE
ncbi:MAG: hypothetical protein E4H14_18855 [Candidatus Thorarchaeota archaeon]|nr:MAG: hypothetical protein E4H14_18855 [Candidatus Thorarchaeota archaeon]